MTEPFDGQSIPPLFDEDRIRAIARDEIKKVIAEKLGDLTKQLLGLAGKAVVSSMANKAQAKNTPPPQEA